MNIYEAVFNVNKSELRKARIAFNRKFGKNSYAKYITPFVKKGIMSMFKVPPTEETRWFAEYIAKLVNARAAKA